MKVLTRSSRGIKRVLKPKPQSLMTKMQVDIISLCFDAEGNTLITTFPSNLVINSKDLIKMIETKADRLELDGNAYILRDEILEAIHHFTTQYYITATASNESDDWTTPMLSEAKRPTNAFILYSNALRKKIKALFPKYTNCEASKFLGAMWKSINKNIKDDYLKQAIECRKLHKLKFPDFAYNIKKKSEGEAIPDSHGPLTDSTGALYEKVSRMVTSANIESGQQVGESSNCCYSSTDNSHRSHEDPLPADCDEWNEVNNLISEFFSERSDQNFAIDNEFWTSFSNEGYSYNATISLDNSLNNCYENRH